MTFSNQIYFSTFLGVTAKYSLVRFAIGLSMNHLRILTGILTGRRALNRHLKVMKILMDPMCRKCSDEGETTYHFFDRCIATVMAPLLHTSILFYGDE